MTACTQGCDGTNPECVDKSSEHAGLPPTVGDKWVATKWIHERQYQDAPPVPAGCYDRHPRCMEWMRREPSECTENPTWMRNHCARACGKCAPE
jgi:prolyl 4-hydroxylase